MQSLASIKKIIRQLKPNLVNKYHIQAIGIFGSATRPDFSEQSDIDILIDFAVPPGIEFIDLAEELENKLGQAVDLVSMQGIKPGYLKHIQTDLIYV